MGEPPTRLSLSPPLGVDTIEPVAVRMDPAKSLELAVDLRRILPFLRTRLIRPAVVCEPDEESESLELEELESLEELEDPIMSANTPGCDSSSIMCWGVLWYMKA